MDKETFMETLRATRAEWESLLAEIGEERMLLEGANGVWSALARAAGVDGQDIVARVVGLCQDVGIPESVRSLGLERDRLPELVDECITQYPRPNNPRPFEQASLLSLYGAMWEGRPAHEWAH